MRLVRNYSPTLIATLVFIFAVCALSFAKSKESNFPSVKIKNFGQMTERFYRGARPEDEDYKALAAIGINTVIDLTDNSMSYEKPAVEALGMRYVNIPIVDKSYPSTEQVNEFLKLIDDPATGKFYVHCAGGKHRTGLMGAVYRFNRDKWNFDQVYAEMKQYKFYSSWGHGKQKDFVEEYWHQIQASNAATPATTTAAAAGAN